MAAATFTTALGASNDLQYTAFEDGLEGNRISITYVVAAGTVPLSIVVTGNDIVVNLATTSGSVTTTGTLLLAAFGTKAQTTLTSDNTNATDGDTITIGGNTYRFKTVTVKAGDIFIGTNSDATMLSLAKCILGTATLAASGADAFTGTLPCANVTCSSSVTSHTIKITALQVGTWANTIVTTNVSSGSHWSFPATTLGGAGSTVVAVDDISTSAEAGATNLSGATAVGKQASNLVVVAASGTITGTLSALSLTLLGSGTPSTLAPDTGYSSQAVAQNAGWVFAGPPGAENGSTQSPPNGDNLHLPTTDRPTYEAWVHDSQGRRTGFQCTNSLATLLIACKRHAYDAAQLQKPRYWYPKYGFTWYPDQATP